MQTLKTKHGDFSFEPLSYDENNLTKVNLNDNGDNVEGIWITVSSETKQLLDKDTHGDYFIAMLCNHALNFNFPSWGLHILCKTKGDGRSTADINWADYHNEENRIYSPEVVNAE